MAFVLLLIDSVPFIDNLYKLVVVVAIPPVSFSFKIDLGTDRSSR